MKLPDTTQQSPGSSIKQQWKGESASCLQGATKRCSQFTPTTLMGTRAKYSLELRRKLKKYCREVAVCLVSILRKKYLPGCFHVEILPCFSPLGAQPPPNHPQAWPVLSGSCFQLLLLLKAGRHSGTGCGDTNLGLLFHLKIKAAATCSPYMISVLGRAHLSLQQQVTRPLERDLFGH